LRCQDLDEQADVAQKELEGSAELAEARELLQHNPPPEN